MGLLFPLLNIATNSIVGLVILRHGTSNGILILVASTVITVAVTGWFSSSLAVIMMALTTGIPVLLLAALLRNTCSLSLSLCSGALLTAAVLLLIEWITGDSQGWWRSLLEDALLSTAPDAEAPAELSSEMVELLVLPFTKLPILVFITAVFALLIARWCHALLDNPGGFANEYRRLRLSATVAIVALGLGGWALNSDNLLLDDLMYVAVVLFFFHGIAIAHAVVAGRKESHIWLVLMYFIIILVPLFIVLMALIGLSDVWLDYRKKLSSGY